MSRLSDEHTPDDMDGNEWANTHTHPHGEAVLSSPAPSDLNQALRMLLESVPLDTHGYTLDWPEISRRTRETHAFCCQYCSVELRQRPDLLHVHHCDRDKTNNTETNLLSLCALCHAQLDGHAHLRTKIPASDVAFIEGRRPTPPTKRAATPTPAGPAVSEDAPTVGTETPEKPDPAPQDEWEKFEILVQRTLSGSGGSREEVSRELSRLIEAGHPQALAAQRSLIKHDKSQSKIHSSDAYDKGRSLFDPMSGDSPFLRG